MSSKRINWTEDEEKQVVAALRPLINANPTGKWKELFREAQKVLPADRQKPSVPQLSKSPALQAAFGQGEAGSVRGECHAPSKRLRKRASPEPEDGLGRLVNAISLVSECLTDLIIESVFVGAARRLDATREQIVKVRAEYLQARAEGREEDCKRLARQLAEFAPR